MVRKCTLSMPPRSVGSDPGFTGIARHGAHLGCHSSLSEEAISFAAAKINGNITFTSTRSFEAS